MGQACLGDTAAFRAEEALLNNKGPGISDMLNIEGISA